MNKLLITFLLLSCGPAGGDKVEEDQNSNTTPDVPTSIINHVKPVQTNLKCEKGTTLSYENFGKNIFLNYCTNCHSSTLTKEERSGAPDKMNFDSLQGIQIWRTAIIDSAIATQTMPPDNEILEINDFKEWLECGAP